MAIQNTLQHPARFTTGILSIFVWLFSLFNPILSPQFEIQSDLVQLHRDTTKDCLKEHTQKQVLTQSPIERDVKAIISRIDSLYHDLSCFLFKTYALENLPPFKQKIDCALYFHTFPWTHFERKASYYYLRLSVLSSLPHPPTI